MKGPFFNWSTTTLISTILIIIIGASGAVVLVVGFNEKNSTMSNVGIVIIIFAIIFAVMIGLIKTVFGRK